jgi:hypothetical protein
MIAALENRQHPRFNPQGLTADIIIEPMSSENMISVQGSIVDMSYTGIKIKLFEALPEHLPKSKIKISLTIPESGIPIRINGYIKHLNEQSECGLNYSEHHHEHEVDDLMFECIKSVAPLS